eukprot:scaffold1886_cov36-Attheya_sp.AAC.1
MSCNRDGDFPAHFIMAASNDARHWGENEFTKSRSKLPRGKFVYCASWKEAAMLSAKTYIDMAQLSNNEISQRYRVVGGSVHAVREYIPQEFEVDVTNALIGLNLQTAESLAQGYCNFTFTPVTTLNNRSQTRESLHDRPNAGGNHGNLFEGFVRQKFSQAPANYVICCQSLPICPPGKGTVETNYQAVAGGMSFGSKRTIVRVNDMIARVKAATDETEMFYPKNESEPLIDMVCRVSDGFEATQVTIR